jgi:glycosyltransferase involved in cell wall biosynthesis
MIKPGVFFTVVYPQALPYLCDVRRSLLNQTRKDFDIVIVNDGCETFQGEEKLNGLNFIILKAEGGFSANRLQGIKYALNHGYEYILFCDADDEFTPNRYERTIVEFKNSLADIIVCNYNIVDEKLNIIIDDYFNQEIPAERWIDADFIKSKNIFGMSNTAIRLGSLPNGLQIPETRIVDWFLYTVLLQKGLKARYITESLVNYRQYHSNMIGINKFNVANFRQLAELKKNHYRLLLENGYAEYESYYQDALSLHNLTDEEIKDIIRRELEAHPHPLWWQIISRQRQLNI